MEARSATAGHGWAARRPAWLLGLVPLALIALALGLFAALGAPGLGERRGPPVEELAIERTVLKPGIIELGLRNDGPDPVRVAQVVVNDAFATFEGGEAAIGRLGAETLRIQHPWIEGEAYEVAVVTSTGATIAHEIPAAVETPGTDLSFFGLMALLGIYVGVIPVALGMLWLPWIRRIPPSWLRVVMALTVGLLAFLAIDATLEGLELAGEGAQAFGGAALVLIGAVIAFIALTGAGEWLKRRRSGDVGRASGAARGGRDRPPQPRRGRRDRLGVRRRSACSGCLPGRGLRAAQHDGGPRHRRAGRALAPDARPPGRARAGRGRPRGRSARGSAPRRSTPASPPSCSGSAPARSSR